MFDIFGKYAVVAELYTFLFVVPFVLGIIVRLLLSKLKKAYLLTFCFLIFNIVVFIFVSNINTHGSEGPMLRCVQCLSFTVSVIITEFVIFIKQRYKRR